MLVANTRTMPNALEGVLRANTINQLSSPVRHPPPVLSNAWTILDPEQRDTTVTVDRRTLGER